MQIDEENFCSHFVLKLMHPVFEIYQWNCHCLPKMFYTVEDNISHHVEHFFSCISKVNQLSYRIHSVWIHRKD